MDDRTNKSSPMMLNNVVDDLKKLKIAVDENKDTNRKLAISEDDKEFENFIDYLIKENNMLEMSEPIAPQAPYKIDKPEKQEKEATKYKVKYVFSSVILYITVVLALIAIINKLLITTIIISLILIFAYNNYSNSKKYCRKASAKYDLGLKEFEKYCAEEKEYQKQYEKYTQSKKEYDDEYEKVRSSLRKSLEDGIPNLKEKKKQLTNEIKKYEGLISERYYDSLGEIIEIFEDGRANNVQDAINIYIADEKANELIRLQKEQHEEEIRARKLREIELDRQERMRERREEQRLRKQEQEMKNAAARERSRAEEVARNEDRRRSEEERRRYNEERKRHQEELRLKNQESNAGLRQCAYCKNNTRCGVRSHNKGNCASFISR